MKDDDTIIEVPLKHLIEWAHKLSNLRMVLDNVYNKVEGVIKEELLHDMKGVADSISAINVDIREDCLGITDLNIVNEIEYNGKEND